MTKSAEKILYILYDKYKEAGKPRPFFIRTPELETEGFGHQEIYALLNELKMEGLVSSRIRQVILEPKGIEYCEKRFQRAAETVFDAAGTVLDVIDKLKP